MIYLIDNWAIDVTPICYSIGKKCKRKNKNTGEEVDDFSVVGYYTSLTGAIKGARKHMRRETLRKFDGFLEDAVKELKALDERLSERLVAVDCDDAYIT